eukprot:5625032-Pyramimonas_sp.AAC.1
MHEQVLDLRNAALVARHIQQLSQHAEGLQDRRVHGVPEPRRRLAVLREYRKQTMEPADVRVKILRHLIQWQRDEGDPAIFDALLWRATLATPAPARPLGQTPRQTIR